MGEDFDYAEAFAKLDVEELKRDVIDRDDRLAGLVAGRLRPLRRAVHPDELARRRHLPHRGRPRRRRRRLPALRAAEQLARQRQPRQGAPAALAGQAEVRQRRSRGPTCWSSPGNVALESMGFETFGFGFGREDIYEPEEIFWGPEDTWLGDERYSGERDLSGPLGCGADGPHLREPRGPQRQPRPARRRPRHPRDVPPDGDERRGDRRADRRRPLLRQDPRRRRRRRLVGPEPEGCPVDEQGLGWKSTYGTGKGTDTITSGLEVTWTSTPDPVGQRLLREPLRPRVGADREPGRRQAVGRQGRRGDHPGRPRPVEEAPPDDADDRPRRCASTRSTRRSRAGSSRTPTSSRWRSPRPGTSSCTATWARSRASSARGSPEPQLWQDPVPAVDHELVDDDDVAALKAKVLDSGLSRARSSSPPPGRRPPASAAPTSAAAPTARGSASSRSAAGRSTPARPTVLRALEGIQQEFNGRSPAARRSRSRT